MSASSDTDLFVVAEICHRDFFQKSGWFGGCARGQKNRKTHCLRKGTAGYSQMSVLFKV